MTTPRSAEQILSQLRDDAQVCGRPSERLATLQRLEESCDAIASGQAESVIRAGLPEALHNFRRKPVLIRPPRIEEFVLAKRTLDLKAKRLPSPWSGPMATSLRKDVALLEYVRARAAEQLAAGGSQAAPSVEKLLDGVTDVAIRSELRFVLAQGRQARQDLLRLKEAMRKLRPTLPSVDASSVGSDCPGMDISSVLPPAADIARDATQANALIAFKKLINPSHLARCGLEYVPSSGCVVERKTRIEFLSRDEVNALNVLCNPGSQGITSGA